MKITHLGASTVIVEHKKKRILFDPWLDDGIVYGAWYRWPPGKTKPNQVGKLDYIIISHIHEDHCSAGTLKHLDKNAEVIIMDRRPNFVKKFLEYNKFNFKKIHLIKPYVIKNIFSDLSVAFVEADEENFFSYLIDSGIVLKTKDKVLYNSNDCLPTEKAISFIKKNFKQVDLALLPYTGVSGYPNCYLNLSHEQKMQESKRISKERMELLKKTAEKLEPKLIMPFADQFVIGGKNYHLNKYSPHPPSIKDVADYFKKDKSLKFLLLNINQSYDLIKDIKTPNSKFKSFTNFDRNKFIKKISKEKYDNEKITLNEAISEERLLEYACQRFFSEQKRQNYKTKWKILFDIKDKDQNKKYLIDLENSKLEKLNGTFNGIDKNNSVTMYIEKDIFIFLLLGHMSWNMADGALFILYNRIPNKFDPKLYAFINYLKV